MDGSASPKKGTHSVGVSRQYCGVLGKTDNYQAGVFVGYSGSKGYGLVDRRLYMPQNWFDEDHGMDHYEARSWNAWHRYMLFVFIAHLFITEIRMRFKKTPCPDHAASLPPALYGPHPRPGTNA